jgi:hypothetical protein
VSLGVRRRFIVKKHASSKGNSSPHPPNQGGMGPFATAPPAPLVAMGIVSAPEYIERRAASRASWLRWENVGPGRAFSVHFVVRAQDAPSWIDRLLAEEHASHGDVLRVAVPWNESRLRGPVLSVAAWLSYAVKELSSARFVAKLDDDAYLHAPGLETVVRAALSAAPNPDRIYMGPMSWFQCARRTRRRPPRACRRSPAHGGTRKRAAKATAASACVARRHHAVRAVCARVAAAGTQPSLSALALDGAT